MPLFTQAQLDAVREIISRYHTGFAISVFGRQVSPALAAQLKAAGLVPADAPQLIDDAYVYAQLLARSGDLNLMTATPESILMRLRVNPQPPHTPAETAAIDTARRHAGEYCRGLGNRVATDIITQIQSAEDELTPEEIQEIIGDETAANRERRETASSLKSALGHRVGNWTRDWLRIATSESQDAIQEGLAATFERDHGDPLVSKIVRPDCCSDCRRLYVDAATGEPKIFRLSTLRANGTNVGKKPSQWKPVVGLTHPWCLPAGERILTRRGEVVVEDVRLGDLVLTHRGRWRRVTATFQRIYQGPMVELSYGDKVLRATPTHPVASGGSWRSAGDIQEGAHLLHAPNQIFLAESDHAPTDHFERRRFARILTGLLPGGVPVSAIYLDGQLLVGIRNVDEKAADLIADLRRSPELRFERLKEHGFQLGPDAIRICADLSEYLFFGARATSPGSICSGRLSFAAFDAETIHPDLRRFARRALRATGLLDAVNDGTAGEPERLGDGIDAHILVEVQATDRCDRDLAAKGSHFDEVAFACVDVTSVNRRAFDGIVYNIAVEDDESYVVNGVVTHNCGCNLVIVPEGMTWEDGELMFGEPTLSKSRRLHDRYVFQGLPISVETMEGSPRHWGDPNGEHGTSWAQADYGYIRETEGADGEHIDCYVGDDADATHAHVVHQRRKVGPGRFEGHDEDKVLLGFPTAADAKAFYLQHYDDPGFFGSMTSIPIATFKKILAKNKGRQLRKIEVRDDGPLEKGYVDRTGFVDLHLKSPMTPPRFVNIVQGADNVPVGSPSRTAGVEQVRIGLDLTTAARRKRKKKAAAHREAQDDIIRRQREAWFNGPMIGIPRGQVNPEWRRNAPPMLAEMRQESKDIGADWGAHKREIAEQVAAKRRGTRVADLTPKLRVNKSARLVITLKKADPSVFKRALVKSAGPFIGPRGGKWADAEHTIPWHEDTTVNLHPGLGYHDKTWKVSVEEDHGDKVKTSINGGSGPTMPKASLKHFKNDLEGKVDVPPSDDEDIEAVRTGKASFLGKGDDGIVFKHGPNTVKVSTTVPYQPSNPGHRTPEEAGKQLEEQAKTAKTLHDEGVPGILPGRIVKHGDKVFHIKPYVETPKLDKQQLDSVAASVRAMHAKGWTLNDQIQVGVHEGKLYHFDIGKASKSEGSRLRDRIEDDESRLRVLYREHGETFDDDSKTPLERWYQLTGADIRNMDAPTRSKHFGKTFGLKNLVKKYVAEHPDDVVEKPEDIEDDFKTYSAKHVALKGKP